MTEDGWDESNYDGRGVALVLNLDGVTAMMKRMCLSVGLTAALGLVPDARAQELGFPGEVVDGPVLSTGPSGGFGLGYIQPPPVTGIPGNRWNLMGGPSYFEGIPYEAAVVPPAPVATPRPAAAIKGRRKGRQVAAAPAPYGVPLPQSRLGGADVPTPPLYSPYSRQQTYGWGYDLGPYGSNYYSGFWKGWPVYP